MSSFHNRLLHFKLLEGKLINLSKVLLLLVTVVIEGFMCWYNLFLLLIVLSKSKFCDSLASRLKTQDSILTSVSCVFCCVFWDAISIFEKPALFNIHHMKELYMYLWVIMSGLIFQRKAFTCHSYQTAQPIQVPAPVNKTWHFPMPQAQKFSKDLHKSHIQDILTKVCGC